MKSKIIIPLIFIGTLTFGKNYTMTQGETILLKATGIKHVFSGNSRVIRVKSLKSHIKFLSVTAIGPGDSSLTLSSNKKNYKHHFTVLSKKIDETYKILKSKFNSIANIKISSGRQKILISGTIDSLDNLNYILKFTEHKKYISTDINITPTTVKLEAQNIIKTLAKIELTGSVLKYLKRLNKIYIKIIVKDKKEELNIVRILKPFRNIIILKAHIEPKAEKSITLEAKFVELKYGKENEYGIKWSDSLKIIPYSKKITALIKAHERTGYAKTIASPRLACASGEKANFLAGGQIPLKIINSQNSSHVEWKKYGIELKFAPRVLKNNIINLKIGINISDLDYSNALDNIPAISSRQIDTALSIKNGETFIISGLIRNNHGKNIENIPILSKLPIIGEFFKSRSFLNDQSELIVLVTPNIDLDQKENLKIKINSFSELMENEK